MARALDLFPARGQIRNRSAAGQQVNFSGLRWGTITPTDLDVSAHRVRCSVDMKGRAFAWVEFKYGAADVPQGQALHLAYLISNSKAPAIAVIARHAHETNEDIDAAAASVDIYMTTVGRVWIRASDGLSVFECLDAFFRKHAS